MVQWNNKIRVPRVDQFIDTYNSCNDVKRYFSMLIAENDIWNALKIEYIERWNIRPGCGLVAQITPLKSGHKFQEYADAN